MQSKRSLFRIYLSVSLNYDVLSWRVSEQKVFVANINKAKNDLEWQPKILKEESIEEMIKWLTTLKSK